MLLLLWLLLLFLIDGGGEEGKKGVREKKPRGTYHCGRLLHSFGRRIGFCGFGLGGGFGLCRFGGGGLLRGGFGGGGFRVGLFGSTGCLGAGRFCCFGGFLGKGSDGGFLARVRFWITYLGSRFLFFGSGGGFCGGLLLGQFHSAGWTCVGVSKEQARL